MALADAAASIGAAGTAAAGPAAVLAGTVGLLAAGEPSLCGLSESSLEDFLASGAAELATAAAAGPLCAAAAMTACDTPESEFPVVSDCATAPAMGVVEEVSAVAAAVPSPDLAGSCCCPDVPASGAGASVAIAVVLAAFAAVFLAPLAAMAFKTAALELAVMGPPAGTWPPRPAFPWGLACGGESDALAVVAVVPALDVELPGVAAGAADGGFCCALGCVVCCAVWVGSDELLDGLLAGGEGLGGAEVVVASSKASKGCEFGSWFADGACIRDAGESEAAALTSDVILGTRKLPESDSD